MYTRMGIGLLIVALSGCCTSRPPYQPRILNSYAPAGAPKAPPLGSTAPIGVPMAPVGRPAVAVPAVPVPAVGVAPAPVAAVPAPVAVPGVPAVPAPGVAPIPTPGVAPVPAPAAAPLPVPAPPGPAQYAPLVPTRPDSRTDERLRELPVQPKANDRPAVEEPRPLIAAPPRTG